MRIFVLSLVAMASAAVATPIHPISVWFKSANAASPDTGSIEWLRAQQSVAGWSNLYTGRYGPFNLANPTDGLNLSAFMSKFGTAAQIKQQGVNGNYQVQNYAGGVAMIAQLTNRNLDVARDLLISLCDDPLQTPLSNASGFANFNWSGGQSPPADDCDMEQAAAMRSLAIGIDVLWDSLDTAQQNQCIDTLKFYTDSMTHAADPTNTSHMDDHCHGGTTVNNPFTGWWWNDYTNNHSWNNYAAIGLAAQVLTGHVDAATQAHYESVAQGGLSRIATLQNLISDGSWHEGEAYLMTGLVPQIAYWIGAARSNSSFAQDLTSLLQFVGRNIYYLQQLDHPHVLAMTNADYNWVRPSLLPALRWVANRFRTLDATQSAFAQAAADRYSLDQSWGPLRFEFALDFALEYVAYAPAPALPSTIPLDLFNTDQQSLITHAGDSMIVAFKSGVYNGNGLRQECLAVASACAQNQPNCTAPLQALNFTHDHEDDLGLWIYGGATIEPIPAGSPLPHAGWSLPEAAGYNCCSPNDEEHKTDWHNTVKIDDQGQVGDDKISTHHGATNCDSLSTLFQTRTASMPLAASTDDVSLSRGDGTHLYGGVTSLNRTVAVGRAGYVVVRDWVHESRISGAGSLTQLFHSLNPRLTAMQSDGSALLDNSIPDPTIPAHPVQSASQMSVRTLPPGSIVLNGQRIDDSNPGFAGSFSENFSPDGHYGEVAVKLQLLASPYTGSLTTVLQPRNPGGNLDFFGEELPDLTVTPLDMANPQSGVIVGEDSWIFGQTNTASTTAGGLVLSGSTTGLDVGMVSYGAFHEPAKVILHANDVTATLSDPSFDTGGLRQLLIVPPHQTIEMTVDFNGVAQLSGTDDNHQPVSPVGLKFLSNSASSVAYAKMPVTFTESNGSFTVTSTAAPTAPVASHIVLTQTNNTTVSVSWTTNVPSSSQVRYRRMASDSAGPTSYSAQQDSGGVTSHTVIVTALQPGSLYQFWVRNSNAQGTAYVAAPQINVRVNSGVVPATDYTKTSSGDFGAFKVQTMVADAAGNLYLAGSTTGVVGSNVTANAGGTDAVVQKRDQNGAVVWSSQYGTSANDSFGAVAIDATGVVVTGSDVIRRYGFDGTVQWTIVPDAHPEATFSSIAIGATSHDVYVYGVNSQSSYVARITSTNTTVWKNTTQYGVLTLDPQEQNAYVILSGALTHYSSTPYDYAPTGLIYRLSTGTGGASSTTPVTLAQSTSDPTHCRASGFSALAADSTGVYVAGWCSDRWNSQNDSQWIGPHERVLLVKFSLGLTPLFVTKSGIESSVAEAHALTLAADGLYLGGTTTDGYLGTQATPPDHPSAVGLYALSDAFYAKFTFDGALAWGTQVGTAYHDDAPSIAIDNSGRAAVLVTTTATGFFDPSGIIVPSFTLTRFAAQPASAPAGVAQPHLIAASTLVDRTSGTVIDTSKWQPWSGPDGSAAVTESGGAISLAPAPNDNQSLGLLQSVGTFDLTNSSGSVQVKSVVNNDGNVNAIFTLQRDWSNQLNWWYEGHNLYANYLLNGTQVALTALTYDPLVHAYWRIRESDGVTCWETSPDGANWIVQAAISTASLFSVKAVSYVLSTSEFRSDASPGSAHFANLNPP